MDTKQQAREQSLASKHAQLFSTPSFLAGQRPIDKHGSDWLAQPDSREFVRSTTTSSTAVESRNY